VKKDAIRVLEIGPDDLFKSMFPGSTTYLYPSLSRSRLRQEGERGFNLRAAAKIWRGMARGEYDLVVLGPVAKALWNSDVPLLRNLRSLLKHLACPSSLGPHFTAWLARKYNVPAIACDRVDTMLISASNFFLFPYVRCYFKRELPQNKWQVFLSTTSRNGDVSNIRRQPFFREALAKVRPFPLNVGPAVYDFPAVTAAQKTIDIFYSGDNPKTTVRSEGAELLARLADQGIRVDIPQNRLPPEEFYRRIAASWLVWSPEGSGWDCARHAEALIHGSVPVINYPTIYRYKPLVDGEHALYYGCEEDHLLHVVRKALQDKEALLRMVEAGRKHLQQWYAAPRVAEYVLREAGLPEQAGRLADNQIGFPSP
jgi:glycosyltransferase involved in cell wall biosynthesis